MVKETLVVMDIIMVPEVVAVKAMPVVIEMATVAVAAEAVLTG